MSSYCDSLEEQPLDRAMPLILRMERDAVPARSALLEAAASAAVALVCDQRSQPGGPWYAEVQPWLAGRIRKVVRRARGAHWTAVTGLPGITIEHRGAQVRALLPWRSADTPRTVTRLQVGGTDVPPDDAGPPPEGLPVLWLPPEPVMTVGKAAAQVGHATVLLAALLTNEGRTAELASWAATGYRCAVRSTGPHQWTALVRDQRPWKDNGVLTVRDAGFTEVPPGTITVAVQFPKGTGSWCGGEARQRGLRDGGVGGRPERGE